MKPSLGILSILILGWLIYTNGYLASQADYLNLMGQKLDTLPSGPHSEDYIFDSKKYTLFIRWEPWSPSSMMNIANSNVLFKKLSEKINIVGICSQWNDGIKEIKRARITFPILFDQSLIIDRKFKSKQLPFYVLIDPEREIIWQGTRISAEELTEIIFSYRSR